MRVTVLCPLASIALRVNILLAKRVDAPIALPVLIKTKTMFLPCRARIARVVDISWTTRRRKKNTTLSTIVSFAKAAPSLQQLLKIAAFALLESIKTKTTTTPPFVSIVHLGNIYWTTPRHLCCMTILLLNVCIAVKEKNMLPARHHVQYVAQDNTNRNTRFQTPHVQPAPRVNIL